ncbi:MAG: nucleotidyltransferase family protein [Candidatus Omnitrophica bacterium]|nr:nucleotidyltransferase family protein [Candidatus Omnitrophota bacterium]
MIETVILVGGQGSRLKSLVKDIPKPMADVGGRPFLEYLIRYLSGFGINRITLSVGYKAEVVRDYFGDGSKFNLEIYYSKEDIPLGTGGALKKASLTLKGESFLALNGDSFFKLDIEKLVSFYREKKAKAVISLIKVDQANRYGIVELNRDQKVISFREKDDVSAEGLINSGIYVFNKKVFDCYKEEKISLEETVFPELIGDEFYGLEQKGFFIDIGVPKDYLRVCDNFGLLLR